MKLRQRRAARQFHLITAKGTESQEEQDVEMKDAKEASEGKAPQSGKDKADGPKFPEGQRMKEPSSRIHLVTNRAW